MLQFPLFFAAWIGTGTVGLVCGSIAVHRAERRSRRLVAQTTLVAPAVREPELVSAA
jgi:hypothetical protein